MDHTVTITRESVFSSSVNSDLRVNWGQLGSVITTPRWLLFLLPPHQVWIWLPQRLFIDNDHLHSILGLAAGHQIRVRRMS